MLTPESPVFITSCRIRQHSHAHTEVPPGIRLLARQSFRRSTRVTRGHCWEGSEAS